MFLCVAFYYNKLFGNFVQISVSPCFSVVSGEPVRG